MLKILYAAGNRFGSSFQLKRFLSSMRNKNIEIKVAAYQNSIANINVDYTLDCLLNFTNTNNGFSKNGNYRYFHNEIKRFGPDLVISDVDVYSSLVALDLGIKLWQVSPLLAYNAIASEVKYNINIHRNHGYLLDIHYRKLKNLYSVIERSDKKFVVSHLGDAGKDINLAYGFEFVRPDFLLAEDLSNDIDYLVANLHNKNISHLSSMTAQYNEIEYLDALGKCKIYVSDGSELLTADAFYNQKPILFDIRHNDVEAVVASHVSEYFGTGSMYSENMNTNNLSASKIVINDNIKFLYEHLVSL